MLSNRRKIQNTLYFHSIKTTPSPSSSASLSSQRRILFLCVTVGEELLVGVVIGAVGVRVRVMDDWQSVYAPPTAVTVRNKFTWVTVAAARNHGRNIEGPFFFVGQTGRARPGRSFSPIGRVGLASVLWNWNGFISEGAQLSICPAQSA